MPKPQRKRRKPTNSDVRKLLRKEGRQLKRGVPKLTRREIKTITQRIMERALKKRKPGN